MTALRIAVVKPDWRIRGGFELVTDKILAHLRGQGHHVDVLGLDAYHYDGRPFHIDVPQPVFNKAPQYFAYVAQVEQCRRVNVRRADAVVSTQPPSFSVPHPHHLSLFYHHNRLFYDLASYAVAANIVSADNHELATRSVREIDAVGLSGVTRFLAGSETIQRRLLDFNGIEANVALFEAGVGANWAAAAHRRQSPDDDRVALCVSRHDFPKRTELFVHAMHLASDIRGVSVGSGGRLGFVRDLDRRLAEHGSPVVLDPSETWLNSPPWIDPATVGGGRVRFVSGLTDDQLDNCYASAFCVVAPALLEDYGLTAIEAMHHGLPVVTCTDSGHLTALVEHGVTGLVVEPTGAALAAAVRRLADDPDYAAELGAHCIERAAEFTWTRAFAQFDEALEATLG